MSVLIRGMERPDDCGKCPFLTQNGEFCQFARVDAVPKDCPLIQLHAHGRLIDVDALLNEWDDYTGFYRMKRKITEEDLIQMIRRQPIVVMSEGEINERN